MTMARGPAERDNGTEWRVVEQCAYDPEGPDDLTTVIIEAVAAAEGVDLRNVMDPPLYGVVDTSAIEDSFFGPKDDGEQRGTVGSVVFEFRGFQVTVRSDGWVGVAETVDAHSSGAH